MQSLKLDLLKFTGAKQFKSKDGVDHIAIPLDANGVFVGQKGAYLELTLIDNKDGPDQYGYEGFAAVNLTKQQREAGMKGPIVGNWKHVGQAKPAQRQAPQADQNAWDDPEGDRIPF